MFFGQGKKELVRVNGGKKLKLTCKNCGKESTWHECNVEDSYKLYAVVELWKNTKRVMQCGECLATVDYYDVFVGEKEEEQKQVEAQKQNELEAEAKKEAEQAAAKEAERKRLEEVANKKRAEEQKAKEAAVDAELLELKKSMGMDK